MLNAIIIFKVTSNSKNNKKIKTLMLVWVKKTTILKSQAASKDTPVRILLQDFLNRSLETTFKTKERQ
jgi:hypothetical protein